jgi:hypothetical protein
MEKEKKQQKQEAQFALHNVSISSLVEKSIIEKACALAQVVIDTCQVISCSSYAALEGKSKRTILYQAPTMTGLEIDNRKFISLVQ